MIVKKSDTRHAEIAAAMEQGFNLSEWVTDAYAAAPKVAPVIAHDTKLTPQ